MLNARTLPTARTSNFPRQEPLPAGTYPARLVQVALLGVQAQRPYKGEAKEPVLEIYLTYELLDEFVKDEDGEEILDKPRWISERMPFHNLQAERANSTKRYYALDPEETYAGEWSELLGTPCMLTIVLDTWKDKVTNEDRFKEKVTNVSSMRPREAAKAPELVNPPRLFNFYEPDLEVWDTFPQWLRDVIKGAENFEGSALEEVLEGHVEPVRGSTEGKEEKKEEEVEKKPKVSRKSKTTSVEEEEGDEEEW